MTWHGPEAGQRPASEDKKEPDASSRQDGQTSMPEQLGQQQRPDDPSDPAGVGLMMSGELFGPPACEVRIGAKQDQPGHRGHGDIDTSRAGLDQTKVHEGTETRFALCTTRQDVKPKPCPDSS